MTTSTPKLTPNFSIDTDPQQQQAASPLVLVARSFMARVKSVVHFVSAAVLVQAALAQPTPIDALTWWRTGVLVGVQSSLSVCAERFPQYREQNAAAYAASLFSNAEADGRLSDDSGSAQSSPLAASIDMFRKGEVLFNSLDPAKLEHVCGRFPDVVAKQSAALFGRDAARFKAEWLAAHREGK